MDRLDCYEFGRALLRAGDLDPVYTLVYHADMDPDTLRRWLLAYWCFYHVGTASWCAYEPAQYWERMRTAAGSKDYPRSSERRHFRGENARKSVAYLEGKGIPFLFAPFDSLPRQGLSAEQVIRYVRTWVGFGPWIAFKVADMIDRCGVVPVSFSADEVMYDSPRAAAETLWDSHNPGIDSRTEPGGVGPWALDMVTDELKDFTAPPRHERPVGVQEAETVLCKWKSYLNGHYHVGEDVAACRTGLLRFAGCRLSQTLIRAGKKGGLW